MPLPERSHSTSIASQLYVANYFLSTMCCAHKPQCVWQASCRPYGELRRLFILLGMSRRPTCIISRSFVWSAGRARMEESFV